MCYRIQNEWINTSIIANNSIPAIDIDHGIIDETN